MDWQLTCRVCLESGDMVSLFDWDENNEQLSDKYTYCCGVEVKMFACYSKWLRWPPRNFLTKCCYCLVFYDSSCWRWHPRNYFKKLCATKLKCCVFCFKVAKNDSLPTLICLNCVDRLTFSYQFKQQCLASNDTLKECLEEFMQTSAAVAGNTSKKGKGML